MELLRKLGKNVTEIKVGKVMLSMQTPSDCDTCSLNIVLGNLGIVTAFPSTLPAINSLRCTSL